MSKALGLLFPGNSKTGSQIALFNLPRVDTCPGATELCIKHCYVKRSNRFPTVSPTHQERYRASLEDDFVDRMVGDIVKSGKDVIRIHTAGDFYSEKYIADWVKIARRTPGVAYYAYTRSWRCKKLVRHLNRLRRLPNVQLWWSSDKETGSPPEGMVAYMSVDDNDIPQFDATLVFRVRRSTVRKKIGGINVCPLESGRPELKKRGLTCAKCRICFSNALVGVQEKQAASA